MPQMGVSVSEGTVTKWLKNEGEPIEADEPLLEISTDKVDTEVPSPGTGVVAKILVQEGETVDVGTVLAVIAPEGAERRGAAARGGAARARDAAGRRRGRRPRRAQGVGDAPQPAAQPPRRLRHRRRAARRRQRRRRPSENGRTFVSPVVARIAAEHGVDPSAVAGHRPGRPRDEEGHPRRSSSPALAAPAPRAAPQRRQRQLRAAAPPQRRARACSRPAAAAPPPAPRAAPAAGAASAGERSSR